MISIGTLAPQDLLRSRFWGASLRASLFTELACSVRGARPGTIKSLKHVRDALSANAVDVALREIDRAWRSLPGEAVRLAPTYARLLSLEGRDHYAALGMLQVAAKMAPDPDIAALTTLTLLRLDRTMDARRQLEQSLAGYCVNFGELLPQVASAFVADSSVSAPGWIGRGRDLRLLGELGENQSSNALTVKLEGSAAFSQMLPAPQGEGPRRFNFRFPMTGQDARLEVCMHGSPLLGGAVFRLPVFALDGRSYAKGRNLSGWVRVGWSPFRPVLLRFEDGQGNVWESSTQSVPHVGWRWKFRLDLDATPLRGDRFQISARLPDGQWLALPDSPLLLEPAVWLPGISHVRLLPWSAGSLRARGRPSAARRARLTDVIIPIFGNRPESLACLGSVLGTVDKDTRVVVVDDASEDLELASALDAYEREGKITLLRNARNRGFVASVNRALALHPTHDALLLNSDTLVFADWLTRLRESAYSAPGVGTVTPLSNSGTIVSYPSVEGAAIDPVAGAVLQTFAAAIHSGHSVEIPVGVGFCLYIRRDCLQDVGRLDEAIFDKGYGEETDFCLRARRRGWSHRLAADVFVYHAGGLSFGGRRAALLDRSQRLINLRHPGYQSFIASFLAQDPLHSVRRRLDEHRLSAAGDRFVLIVTLALTGGVDRFVGERIQGLRAKGLHPLVLRPVRPGDRRRCELWTDALELPNLQYDVRSDLPTLSALLRCLNLSAVEIQHFLHLDARLIEAVRALPLPYDVFIHDYAWICPRVTLLDGNGRYCGEPDVSACQICVRRHGSELGESISVPALRARSARWLEGARRVTAPSLDAASRLQRHFHGLQVLVEPHPVSTTTPITLGPRDAACSRVRVALIGAIGTHKGFKVLLRCARDARARQLPLEFVVIGYTEEDAPLLATGRVFVTGSYTENEVPELLRRERPDVAWLPSVWPETWCYTLDHALSTSLPVVAFDLGAIAERLQAVGKGELLALGLTPRQINDRLLQIAGSVLPPSVQLRLSHPHENVNILPTQSPQKTMNNPSNGKPREISGQEEGLSASVQVLPLPPGLYLFSVKTSGAAVAREAGNLTLPAVHVGLGPGVRTEQVEFIAGPSTSGAWLFAEGDLLVTKVNGVGATLIMTSVRAPGGQVLSIKVERLEGRANELATPVQAAAAVPATAKPTAASKGRGAAAPGDVNPSTLAAPSAALPLPVHIAAHVRTRGDMNFANVSWAGRVGPGLWIESFAVRPLERFGAQDIEYKGLTSTGFETPWLSDDKMCGTKGMAVPLVGFAVRLKPSAAAGSYDCEYSGYYQSGQVVGPQRNGAPCRSTVANDPLEGIQIRLIKRPGVRVPPAKSTVLAKKKSPKGKTPERISVADDAVNRTTRSTGRPPTRRP